MVRVRSESGRAGVGDSQPVLKFIPGYFLFYEAVRIGPFFFSPPPDFFLSKFVTSVWKIRFYILVLSPASLLKLWIKSECMGVLRLLKMRLCYLQTGVT